MSRPVGCALISRAQSIRARAWISRSKGIGGSNLLEGDDSGTGRIQSFEEGTRNLARDRVGGKPEFNWRIGVR